MPSATGVNMTGVGIIGLGAMGRPMAKNLIDRSSHTVHVTGRGAARYADLVAAGAQWHDNPRSLAAAVDVVILMLPDLPEVEAVLGGLDGLLAAQPDDLLLVISSTSSPSGVRELAQRLEQEHAGAVRVVDAPVSGGVDGAEAATLSVMIGGRDEDAATAAGILAAVGNPVHLGPLGAGQVAKACNQLIVASTILALGEAAVLAERSGLDLAKLFDLLAGGYADSRILRTRGQRIVEEDYSPSGTARYMVKDLDFATSVATLTGTRPVLLPAVKAAFEELTEQGLGDRDISVTRAFIEGRVAPVTPG
ncbi:NAD(P)-dependent oxidoreductase [Lapillicoccus sp.]|uniref:NAD(P)-dependent oxidoreductase n=1 Tax=Lapillicoccus sp. TaxID=1909287 RepID=UPI0032662BC1